MWGVFAVFYYVVLWSVQTVQTLSKLSKSILFITEDEGRFHVFGKVVVQDTAEQFCKTDVTKKKIGFIYKYHYV